MQCTRGSVRHLYTHLFHRHTHSRRRLHHWRTATSRVIFFALTAHVTTSYLESVVSCVIYLLESPASTLTHGLFLASFLSLDSPSLLTFNAHKRRIFKSLRKHNVRFMLFKNALLITEVFFSAFQTHVHVCSTQFFLPSFLDVTITKSVFPSSLHMSNIKFN